MLPKPIVSEVQIAHLTRAEQSAGEAVAWDGRHEDATSAAGGSYPAEGGHHHTLAWVAFGVIAVGALIYLR